ncbi:hypothetical protein AAVH_07996 [Aphelenchoides avenae]|nr:hypothetical protein AAVH_16646 [Aphelenchus avenae]KAH7724522.1 hypothetical protein AAVH_07996 [Aphelenchus avenae]
MANAVGGRSPPGTIANQTGISRNPGLDTLRWSIPLEAAVHRTRPTPSGPGHIDRADQRNDCIELERTKRSASR